MWLITQPKMISKNNKQKKRAQSSRTEKRAQITISSTQVAVTPDRMTVKMKYVETIDLNTTATGIASNLFRLNSIYDPNYTGSGHQPTGHDQWAYFYQYYRVLRCRVRALAEATTQPHSLAMGPTTSSATSTYIQDRAEDPRAKVDVVSPNGPKAEMVSDFDMKALFGVPASVYGTQDVYSAVFATNPGAVMFLEVAAYNNAGATTGHVYLTMELEYIVEMYNRVDLAPSLLKQISEKSAVKVTHPTGCQCGPCLSRQ